MKEITHGELENGMVVRNQGYEFVASNVTKTEDERTSKVIVRYTGTCTDNACNDSIRRTSYNGGTYGANSEVRIVQVEPLDLAL